MKRILFITITISFLIFSFQPAHSATTVEFVDGGGADVFGIQFDVAPATGWSFTPGDAIPGWLSTEIPPTNSPIAYFSFAGAAVSGQIGSFASTVTLSNFVLTDTGGFLVDPISVNFDGPSDTYTVSNVPIPSTILLLGAGLVGLVGMRRRVKS